MPRSPATASRLARLGGGGLLGLFVGAALFRMPQNVGITTLSLLARQGIHAGAGTVGLLGSLAGLVVAAVTLVVSGRIPHTRAAGASAVGMVLLAVSLLVLAVAPSLALLVVGSVLLGVAGGIVMPSLVNAVVVEAPARRERAIAIYTVVLSVSLAVGPALESVALAAGGQDARVPFAAFAVVPLAGALAVIARHGRRGFAHAAAGVPWPVTSAPPAAPTPTARRRGWRDGLLSTAAGRDALLAQLLYAVPFAGVTVFGALVARIGYGQTPAEAQLGFTVFFVCSLAARFVLSWRAPIARKPLLLWLAALLTAVGLVLLAIGGNTAELYLAMALLGIPHGLTFPLALALVAEATPVEGLPRANATLIGSTNLTSVLVPLALGAVVPAVGYKALGLVMLAPVAVFALARLALSRGPLGWWVPGRRHPESREGGAAPS